MAAPDHAQHLTTVLLAPEGASTHAVQEKERTVGVRTGLETVDEAQRFGGHGGHTFHFVRGPPLGVGQAIDQATFGSTPSI